MQPVTDFVMTAHRHRWTGLQPVTDLDSTQTQVDRFATSDLVMTAHRHRWTEVYNQ